MKTLKRIRYNTMNSWNNSESLAYNLKIYNVIDDDLQDAAYKLLDDFELDNAIRELVDDFGESNNYEWQAGFNGRSGGYLVLYRGGQNKDGTVYIHPVRSITEDEVPTEIKRAFKKLAVNIVKTAEQYARKLKRPTLTDMIAEAKVKLESLKNIKYKVNALNTLAEVDTLLEQLMNKVENSDTYI